jgi:lipoyl(octanoyl) transferase
MEFDVRDLGFMAYEPCVEVQKQYVEQVLADGRSTLLFVEHPPVLTLGANFHDENLLLPLAEYEKRGIQVVRTDRGGDVTYHGPGQLVIYPIFNVAEIGRDLHKWMRDLEETMLLTLSSFGLEGRRFPPHTGAWIGDKKVAAIGVKIRKWVSMHGIALNCNNDLAPFDLIVPCGIQSYGVTSLTRELGRDISLDEAKPVVINAFRRVFGRST